MKRLYEEELIKKLVQCIKNNLQVAYLLCNVRTLKPWEAIFKPEADVIAIIELNNEVKVIGFEVKRLEAIMNTQSMYEAIGETLFYLVNPIKVRYALPYREICKAQFLFHAVSLAIAFRDLKERDKTKATMLKQLFELLSSIGVGLYDINECKFVVEPKYRNACRDSKLFLDVLSRQKQ